MSARSARLRAVVSPTGVAGAVVLTIIGVAVLFAPWLAPFDPKRADYGAIMRGPSHRHWFGTDDLGHDVLSQTLIGGRATLAIGVVSVVGALLLGTCIGVVAGYRGGWTDATFMRLVDVWLSFPSFLLLLAVVAALGPGVTTIVLAIVIASTPSYARAVRGATLGVRGLDYVLAAQLSGTRSRRIMVAHVVPAISGVVVVYAALGLGGVILATTGLNFLGLGVQPPNPEWGSMLAVGNQYLREAWWMSVFPGAAIFLTVLGVNLVGASLRDVLDPRLSRRL
ncbi:MAG: ABC transporter permease [Actinomycetota bacterium]